MHNTASHIVKDIFTELFFKLVFSTAIVTLSTLLHHFSVLRSKYLLRSYFLSKWYLISNWLLLISWKSDIENSMIALLPQNILQLLVSKVKFLFICKVLTHSSFCTGYDVNLYSDSMVKTEIPFWKKNPREYSYVVEINDFGIHWQLVIASCHKISIWITLGKNFIF